MNFHPAVKLILRVGVGGAMLIKSLGMRTFNSITVTLAVRQITIDHCKNPLRVP